MSRQPMKNPRHLHLARKLEMIHVIKQHDIRKQKILIVYVHDKLNILTKNNTSRKRETAKPKMI